ncbi:hypothetical protein H310_07776 [Aphanomyces invadans]|uniref:Uncharacterized protein n=1 Tax=Aphanomyces invadans TaxID=157072 RepID=A0A024U1D6_9STRA|nr:hypothetical protein H310_07776 [Aphanomyces invadans]ETV99716.1 hypothetical protein H310_07776 [Aphanomyces invadans]|eukprot:XP_008871492.1 hypothetical protein H310_07776 [Aphanomyces invadans]
MARTRKAESFTADSKSSIQYILNPASTCLSLLSTDECLGNRKARDSAKRRQCEVGGCTHFIASRHRCIRHGRSAMQPFQLLKRRETERAVLDSRRMENVHCGGLQQSNEGTGLVLEPRRRKEVPVAWMFQDRPSIWMVLGPWRRQALPTNGMPSAWLRAAWTLLPGTLQCINDVIQC